MTLTPTFTYRRVDLEHHQGVPLRDQWISVIAEGQWIQNLCSLVDNYVYIYVQQNNKCLDHNLYDKNRFIMNW